MFNYLVQEVLFYYFCLGVICVTCMALFVKLV